MTGFQIPGRSCDDGDSTRKGGRPSSERDTRGTTVRTPTSKTRSVFCRCMLEVVGLNRAKKKPVRGMTGSLAYTAITSLLAGWAPKSFLRLPRCPPKRKQVVCQGERGIFADRSVSVRVQCGMSCRGERCAVGKLCQRLIDFE